MVRDDILRQVMAMLHHSSVSITEHYLGLEADREKRLRLKGPMFAPSRASCPALRREGQNTTPEAPGPRSTFRPTGKVSRLCSNPRRKTPARLSSGRDPARRPRSGVLPRISGLQVVPVQFGHVVTVVT